MADIYDFLKELTRIEVEYIDKNDDYYSLKSYIKEIQDAKILIEPPYKHDIVYNVPVGQQITINLVAADCVYSGESEVLGKELSSISGIWISYPHYVQRVQRREYFRVPLNLDADIIIYRDNKGNSKDTFRVNLKDLSGSGFSYLSKNPLINYFDIECRIYIDGRDFEPIISRCEHIYSNKIKENTGNKYNNAFSFINIQENDIGKIVKASFKYQLEQRKKALHKEEQNK